MENFIKPLKIGAFTCPSNLMLAPMAGISDAPLRKLCLRGGAGLVCAEMVSANALKFENQKSLKMLRVEQGEHPLSMQVFGGDAQTIALACKKAQQQGADIIDINAGCPARKVNKAGAGCVLMKEPQKIAQILEAAAKSVSVPVTLKTRIALTRGELLGPMLARVAQESGASAVIMHARAAADMHSGPPDLEALAKVCAAVSIPVIGNGGVDSPQSAKAMFEAGCAGVMIGRAAAGNPFIFKEIQDALQGKEARPMPLKEKLALFKELIEENIKRYGPVTGVSRSKKTVGYWMRGFEGASAAREALVRAQAPNDALAVLTGLIIKYN